MKQEQQRRIFPTTDWSLLANAASPSREREVKYLIGRYGEALRLFAQLQWRLTPDQAAEVTQAFVADKLLEKRLLEQADRARGRFRTLLLASFTRFAIDRWRKDRRGIEARALDAHALASVADEHTRCFERTWAHEVLRLAVEQTRQELTAKQKVVFWLVFARQVLAPAFDDERPLPYNEVVKQFQFETPGQAMNALVTAKRVFRRKLTALLGRETPATLDLEEELRELWRLLRK